MNKKIRLDTALVEEGFFSTAEDARRAVMAGLVSADGTRFVHASEIVTGDTKLHVKQKRAYVSRAGEKLAHALAEFNISPRGKRALDMGCSSGGFTDVLLRQGAAHVLAVDVGRAQFAWALRQDPRVELLERTKGQALINDKARKATADIAVCDVSFCSVLDVLDAITFVLAPQSEALILVKPQFEAPRADVCEGGIVRDKSVQEAAVHKVCDALTQRKYRIEATTKSAVKGAHGNQEYFVWATHP